MRNIKGLHEEAKRSGLKTISWRIVSTVSTMLAVFALTGQLDLTVAVGLIDVFLRMPLYFFHERAWNRIAFGKTIRSTMESAVRTPPVTALPSDTVSTVIQKMVVSDIGAVIVVEGKKPHGLITEKDIIEKIADTREDPSKTFAKDIMSSPAATVEYKESLTDMLKTMRDRQVRRLVVTKKGEVAGLITERRILEALT